VNRVRAYFCSEECHDAFVTLSALTFQDRPILRIGMVFDWDTYVGWLWADGVLPKYRAFHDATNATAQLAKSGETVGRAAAKIHNFFGGRGK